jgi:hypothetical protein
MTEARQGRRLQDACPRNPRHPGACPRHAAQKPSPVDAVVIRMNDAVRHVLSPSFIKTREAGRIFPASRRERDVPDQGINRGLGASTVEMSPK